MSTPRRRIGFFRWIVLAIFILGIIVTGAFPPIQPHVQLPAEAISEPLFVLPVIGEFRLTNTLLATFLVDILLIALAYGVYRSTRDVNRLPGGISGLVITIIEALYGLVESTAGKWARRVFPYMATIFLLVLAANLMELIPGVDSIGWLHHVEPGAHGYPVRYVGSVGLLEKAAEEGHAEEGYSLIPFIRVASTDLNFTIALALIAVVMTQVMGVRAIGVSYFGKFIAFGNFLKMWVRERLGPFDVIFPFIDIFVGILEMVAEFAKILSFSFRLLGNIFAGSVLLFVMGTLVPMIQSGFLFLELFVGLIQALVFGMLTMVFMTMAMQSHGNHEGEHA
ncbi:MAG: F0F1 ATP synthase subunit A [Anaerolineales bacterium]|nr:F0F1 ATP synthase subunit A [Anaerolineales bacterium]